MIADVFPSDTDFSSPRYRSYWVQNEASLTQLLRTWAIQQVFGTKPFAVLTSV